MDALIRYLILSTLSLSLAYGFYLLVFRKERNFKHRRFFLLSAVLFALIIPLGDFYIKITPREKTETTTVAPSIETPPNSVSQNFPVQNYVRPLPHLNVSVEKEKSQIEWIKIMLYLYFSITALFILRILVQILVLYVWTSKSKQIKQSFFTLVLNARYQNPFSFFKWIFIHNKTKRDTAFEKIIAHESIHVQQKHSIDALLFEILCAIMWFNPFVWMMRNSIQLVHEYLADEGALKSGINSLQYQTLLVNQIAEGNVISLSSHFSSSTVKKRINMMINSKFYTKTKYKILAIIPVAALLFLIIAGFNGLNEQKVMQRLLQKNATISNTFNRDEITELAKIRVLVDNMIQKQTGETESKKAYEKYISYLREDNKLAGIENKIALPHDSLIQVIKDNSTFQEIWNIDTLNNNTYFITLNTSGKIFQFIRNLSDENQNYSNILNAIDIAGDISPANIADFLKVPENYNWNSEAEKLYASVLLVILTNKTLMKSETIGKGNKNTTPNFLIPAKIDTTLLRNAFIKYQKNPSEINALAVYNLLPEKGHIKLANTGQKLIGEIGNNLKTLEEQVLQEKRNSVKLAFRLFTISDGAFTEWLQIILGQLIQVNPEMFLEELIIHQHLCHELPIRNFGPKFVDKFDEQLKEAERRIKALQTVSSPDLMEIKKWCISELQHKQEGLAKTVPVTMIDEFDYSPEFVEELTDLLGFNKKMLLDSNKITTNDNEIFYFPDYIPLNFPTELRGNNDKMEVQLLINRINQSTIAYRFQLKQNNDVSDWISGKAHLPAGFFFEDETDKDERTGEIYSSQQFIDRNTDTNIRIGKGAENGLRIKANSIHLNNCPVLTTEKKEWPQKDQIQPKNEILQLGYLTNNNVQFLFSLLKIIDPTSPYTFATFDAANKGTGTPIYYNIREWLSYEDLIFLMSIVESEELCKGLQSTLSSNLPFDKKATVGGLACFFLDLYRKDKKFFSSQYIAPHLNLQKVEELKEWWSSYEIPRKTKSTIVSPKNPNNEIKRIGYLNETPVKQLFNILQLKGFLDPDFVTQQTFVTFSSPFDSSISRIRDWLSLEDLEFLMSVLDSEQECKCLVSHFSSNLPQGAKATVGGFAALFLDAYKKDKPLPRGGIICPTNDKNLEEEIKQWWAKGKDNLNKKEVGFSIYNPPINGLYELENKEKGQIGGLFIYPVSNELLLFRLIVDQSKPLLKSGELTGEIKLADRKNGTFYYNKKIVRGDGTYTDQYKCQLKFIFGNNSVEIKTIEGKCGLGDDIFPDGVYTKKSNKKPQTLDKRSESDNEFLPEIFQKTNRQFKVGDIDVIVTQIKNNNYQLNSDFVCRGIVKTHKNNVIIDSLTFDDMEAGGSQYGLNFDTQPFSDLIVGLKFGDYKGRLIIIPETGKIENYPGGPFFIPKNKNLIVSRWHSDLSGITIYDVEKKKVVMQKELPAWLASDLFYFQDEYYARWENNDGINAIFKLDLDKFELVKSEKTLAEIKKGEKVEYYNSDCDCN